MSIFKVMQNVLPDLDTAYGLIYCTTNLVNGKKYIGQTKRINKQSYIGSGVAFDNAVKKYGKSNFNRETLQYCIDQEDLNESEIYWVDFFGADKSDLFYNIAPGGRGGKASKETCDKISYSLIGHEVLIETRKKIGDANRNRVWSEESRNKMSAYVKSDANTLRNVPRTNEVKDKIRLKVKSHPIFQIDIKTGDCLEWSSVNHASKVLSIDSKSIWSCIKGKYSHCQNYFWIYKKDIVDNRINWEFLLWNYVNRDRIPQSKPKIFRKDIFLFERNNSNELLNTSELSKIKISKVDFYAR